MTELQPIHHLKKEAKTMAEAEARDIKLYKGTRGGDFDRRLFALYVDGKLVVAADDYDVLEVTLELLGYEPGKNGYYSDALPANPDDLLISHGVEIIESGDFVLGGEEDGHNLRYAALTLAHVEVFREIREHAEAVRSRYREGSDRTEDEIEKWPGDEEWPGDE